MYNHCIIFDICYMMNSEFIWYLLHDILKHSQHIYSVSYSWWILPVLISKCCIEFNHYKTRIYSITVFYNTLKLNHIILYHIWYLQYIKPTVLYIFEYSQYWFQNAVLNLITTNENLLYYSILKHSQHNRIILYHIWYLLHDEH